MSKDKDKDAIHEAFAQYLRDLREFAAKEKTEHTDRGALEKLLKAIAAVKPGKLKVQHEPKRDKEKGPPDFKITESGMILGYVQNKAIGENLTKVLKSDQIAKYKTLSSNIKQLLFQAPIAALSGPRESPSRVRSAANSALAR